MSLRWKPSVTVAAVIERDGRFLMVEEETAFGLKLNQPAGHLDPDESLPAACAREVLEETAWQFTADALVGVYLARGTSTTSGADVTYLRFAFCGTLGALQPERALDEGIVQALWLTPAQIEARVAQHRSPLVMQCLADYLRGARYPLTLLTAQPSALGAMAGAAQGAASSPRASP